MKEAQHKEKIIIGYDFERKRTHDTKVEFKKRAVLDILSYLKMYNSVNVQLDDYKTFKSSFLSEIEIVYKKSYPGVSMSKIYDLLDIDLNHLETLENNFNKYSHEVTSYGIYADITLDFNFYAETENEIVDYQSLVMVLDCLRALKNNGRTILIGELNNALFGAFAINYDTLTIQPNVEFIKNPLYSKRRGNPRTKL